MNFLFNRTWDKEKQNKKLKKTERDLRKPRDTSAGWANSQSTAGLQVSHKNKAKQNTLSRELQKPGLRTQAETSKKLSQCQTGWAYGTSVKCTATKLSRVNKGLDCTKEERARRPRGIHNETASIHPIRNNGGERQWAEMSTEPSKQEQSTQK